MPRPAKKKTKKKAPPAAVPVPRAWSSARRYGGAALAAVAAVAALLLVIQHFAGAWLPGCGPGSACQQLAKSAWGRVPGIGWPVSHVGLAYFAALAVAWALLTDGVPAWLRWIVRLGALGSVVLVGVMAAEGHWCLYCLAVHVANLALWWLTERSPASPPAAAAARSAPVAAAGVFAAATAALVVVQLVQGEAIAEQAERDRSDSTRRIIAGGGDGDRAGGPFTGRYRLGPEVAPIRLVVFSDYQCVDCNRVEGELRAILSGRDDISLSAKHFPLCKDCNAFARERNVNPHPNACWAARAAETAGILRGNDGFWQMHFWLFERRGSFTDAELRAGLTTLGYDPDEFIRTMQSPRTLELVQADIAEAMDLGIHYTPMIFINGVEMRGWTVPGALARTVAEVTASRPVAAGPDADRPPTAADKHVGDWRNSPPKAIAPDEQGWPLGPDDAAVRVVVWSDLQVPMTAELDAGIRRLVGERADTRYEYRHYPVDQACNPSSSRTMYPLGCRAAAAAEAAGRLGGADAYWRMHDWLLANRDRVGDDAALRAAATACGLAPDALLAEMETDEVRRGILRDALAGQSAGLRGVPTVFVNERFVPRFRLEGDDVMRRIVEAAAAGDS